MCWWVFVCGFLNRGNEQEAHLESKRNTSSIQGDTCLVNRMQAQGSMYPPKGVNHLRTTWYIYNWLKDPLTSHMEKREGGWSHVVVGRPWYSADTYHCAHESVHEAEHHGPPTFHCALSSLSCTCRFPIGSRGWFQAPHVSLPAEAPWFPPINTRGGGGNGDT